MYDDDLFYEEHANTSDFDNPAEDERMEDFERKVDGSEFIGPGLTDQVTLNLYKSREEILRRNERT